MLPIWPKELAQRLADLSLDPGTYPLGWSKRSGIDAERGGEDAGAAAAEISIPIALAGHQLLSMSAGLDSPALTVHARLAPQLAALFLMLGAELPSGFWFRVGASSEPSGRPFRLSALELAALTRSDRLQLGVTYIAATVSRETHPPSGATGEPSELPPCHLADPGPLRDQLVAAVLAGEKTATSSLLAEYHDEPLPRPGERFRVVDSQDCDVCVIECTAVDVRRLWEFDDQFAQDEGEGFAGAAEWRAAHEGFWNADGHVRQLGIEVDDQTLVVGERFRVVR